MKATKVSLSSLTSGAKFRFDLNGEVFTITRNCAATPSNSPTSGYVYYVDGKGNKGRSYSLNVNVYVID